ncbi:ABC transporter ATP-binding protein [Blastopirellula retiformator]|uniref:Uncharacterized protein n=1 Tax=Blastopirellula retiformator TaxID=2527970 RepID=A0A5C5V9A5_9BACT|nr:ABC transporter ATP-binding protein [Blastopirellula retiformator]TWT34447.1 hypothetical protein Enr8_18560 [Blastopirellula retiformator]
MSLKKPPEAIRDETFRQYAWDYFALHSDHRMRAFHFYVILSTALLGGFALLMRTGSPGQLGGYFGLILGFLLIYFSFAFSKLDKRTRRLVKNGEDALVHLDRLQKLDDVNNMPNPVRLFSFERVQFEKLREGNLTFEGMYYNYAECFRFVFWAFALVGLLVMIVSGFVIAGKLEPGGPVLL